MANKVNARAVSFPARGPGRPFRPGRAFENSPAIYDRVVVRQNQSSPAGTKELLREPSAQGGKKTRICDYVGLTPRGGFSHFSAFRATPFHMLDNECTNLWPEP